jgi:hypothetical protein
VQHCHSQPLSILNNNHNVFAARSSILKSFYVGTTSLNDFTVLTPAWACLALASKRFQAINPLKLHSFAPQLRLLGYVPALHLTAIYNLCIVYHVIKVVNFVSLYIRGENEMNYQVSK